MKYKENKEIYKYIQSEIDRQINDQIDRYRYLDKKVVLMCNSKVTARRCGLQQPTTPQLFILPHSQIL